jgi:hypothetical protein
VIREIQDLQAKKVRWVILAIQVLLEQKETMVDLKVIPEIQVLQVRKARWVIPETQDLQEKKVV